MVQFGAYYDFRRDPNRPDQSFEQRYREVLEGKEAVDEIVSLVHRFPQIEDLHFFGFLPGEPSETANERLEYISTKILPELRTPLMQGSEVDR